MRTLASFIFTSLDGFYEGPNGELDWSIVDEEFKDFALRQLDEADTLGFGRATYEHMAAYWPTDQAQANDPAIASRMNTKPKLVFSTALEHVSWSSSTIIDGEAIERIEAIKSAPGGELLVIGSAHPHRLLRSPRVLDELRILVCPIALGQGRSLFEDLKDRVTLQAGPREAVRLRQRPPYLPPVAGAIVDSHPDRIERLPEALGRASSVPGLVTLAGRGPQWPRDPPGLIRRRRCSARQQAAPPGVRVQSRPHTVGIPSSCRRTGAPGLHRALRDRRVPMRAGRTPVPARRRWSTLRDRAHHRSWRRRNSRRCRSMSRPRSAPVRGWPLVHQAEGRGRSTRPWLNSYTSGRELAAWTVSSGAELGRQA